MIKIRNLMGAMVALAGLAFGGSAFAAGGDIVDIRAVDSSGMRFGSRSRESGMFPDDLICSEANPLVAGETVYFRVRMQVLNAYEVWASGGSLTPKTWRFWDVANGKWAEDGVGPKLGLSIGNRVAWADFSPTGVEYTQFSGELQYDDNGNSTAAYRYYTDFYFSYKVQAGDVGQPIRLINKYLGIPSATEVSSDPYGFLGLNVGSAAYELKNEDGTEANLCRASGLVAAWPTGPWSGTAWEGPILSSDLSQEGVFVKTVDFDKYDAAGDLWQPGRPWRRVTPGGYDKSCPAATLAVEGDVPAEDTIPLYVWSGNKDVFTIEGGSYQTINIGTTDDPNYVDVYTVQIQKGRTASDAITLRGAPGVALTATAEIFMTSTKGVVTYDAAGTPRIVAMSRPITVTEAQPPTVKIRVNNRTDTQPRAPVVADADYTVPKADLWVIVEGETATKTVVDLKATVGGSGSLATLVKNNIIRLSESDYPTEQADSVGQVEIPAGTGTRQAIVHLYALGTDDDVRTDGIKFQPVVISGDPEVTLDRSPSSNVVIDRQGEEAIKFVQTNPADGSSKTLTKTDSWTIRVKFADSYRNYFKPKAGAPYTYAGYTFKFMDDETGDEYVFAEGVTPASAGSWISVTGKIDWDGFAIGSHPDMYFYGEAMDGSTTERIRYTINLTTSTKVVTIGLYDPTSPTTVCESDTGAIEVKLGLKSPYENGYVFLRPSTDSDAGLVESDLFRFGAAIDSEDNMQVTNPGLVRYLDGKEGVGTPVVVKAFLGTTYDDPESTVANWSEGQLRLIVTNRAPVVKALKVANMNFKASDSGKVTAAVPSGIEKKFALTSVEDVKADWDSMDIRWVIGETVVERHGDPTNEANTVTHTFAPNLAGKTVEVEVYVKDKDMATYPDLPNFSCLMPIGTKPGVRIETDGTIGNMFMETATEGSQTVRLTLSEPATEAVEVKFTVGNPSSGDGHILFQTTEGVVEAGGEKDEYVVKFPATVTTRTLRVVKVGGMDGTGTTEDGVVLNAEVTTATANPDGIPWNTYFSSADPLPVYVMNVPPQFKHPSDLECANTNESASINTPYSIKIQAADVPADVTNRWTYAGREVQGIRFEVSVDNVPFTNGFLTVSNVVSAIQATDLVMVNVEFDSVGVHTVEVVFEDKDGAGLDDPRQIVFNVKSSKVLKLFPVGPGPASSSLGNAYAGYQGLGAGRVFAGLASQGPQKVENFIHTYAFLNTQKEVDLWAFGYPADGKADDGNLVPGPDRGIDKTGNWNKTMSIDADGYYNYTDDHKYGKSGYDSFMYGWVGGVASDESEVAAQFFPYLQKTGYRSIALPDGNSNSGSKDEIKTYPLQKWEAVFSREFLKSDNCGDINADGIPDCILFGYGLGIVDVATKEITGEGGDKADASAFNGDQNPNPRGYEGESTAGDFLPVEPVAMYGDIIPGLTSSWDEPFTAVLEVRGIGSGRNAVSPLNDALASELPGLRPDDPGVANRLAQPEFESDVCFLDPDTNPTSTLSRVEFLAWRGYAAANGIADPDDPASWRKDGRLVWSPERPTDPTLVDTDGDGFPDGYEYYYWYRAHVGWIDANGIRRRLTGRRYDPKNPCEGTPITSDELEIAMDPVVASGNLEQDSDNDGIPDILEMVTGTNPFDFDTDGDGLPDGYEVLIGTNPLKFATDDGTVADSLRNPDGDAMAFEYAEGEYRVLGFQTEDGSVVYRAIEEKAFGAYDYKPVTATIMTSDGIEDAALMVAFKVGGREYVTSADPLAAFRVVEGTAYLAADLTPADTWLKRIAAKGDNKYVVRGLPASLPRGTALDEVPELTDLTPVFKQFVGFTADSGATSENALGLTNMPPTRAYAAFKYGIDGLDVSKKPVFGKFAVGADAEIRGEWTLVYVSEELKTPVYLMHHIAYQAHGFDPRAGWSEKQTKSRAFTTYDEFLALTFHLYAGGLSEAELVPMGERTWLKIWKDFLTDPAKADTDDDGMPDGWEYYVMAGPKTNLRTLTGKEEDAKYPIFAAAHPNSAYSPLSPFGNVADKTLPDTDGLDFVAEFCGVESVAAYEGAGTVANVHPEWTNKRWPTDPWNADTDGDGIKDGIEGGFHDLPSDAAEAAVCARFLYDGSALNATKSCYMGGGLNPLSWDTDADGLPDPWEAEFAGTATAAKSETSVDPATGATNTVATAGSMADGMDATVNDANLDIDRDGLANWQEYIVGAMRCWRYDDTFSSWGAQDFDPMELDPMMGVSPASANWGRYWYEHLVRGPNTKVQNVADGSKVWNPNLVNDMFDAGAGYFSLCTNAWDAASGKWYMFKDGIYHDLRNPGPEWAVFDETGKRTAQYNRFTWWCAQTDPMGMLFKFTWGDTADPLKGFIYPEKYICCNPTKYDTDNDGMDDFYELFHGLNPLLGKSQGFDDGKQPTPPVDIVFEAYSGLRVKIDGITGQPVRFWSAEDNFWLNPDAPQAESPSGARLARTPLKGNSGEGTYDFVAYPWLAGLKDADADGDNIRNWQEAIFPNAQGEASHTDPTPLWMTDFSYTNSLTRRYYQPAAQLGFLWKPDAWGEPAKSTPYFEYDANGDGEIDPRTERWDFRSFPGWTWTPTAGLTVAPYVLHEAFGPRTQTLSFEENEGYDSDHDFLSDFEETEGKTKAASDPQVADSPLRRQAMWFNGADSFLETPLTETEYQPADGLVPVETPFLHFTAECWAHPDPACDLTKPQTVLERAVWVGESALGDAKHMRKNFQIGIRDGKWFGKFDSNGTDAKEAAEIADGPAVATNAWTHLALSYDGTTLRLYVNGQQRGSLGIAMTPAHGTFTPEQGQIGQVTDGKDSYPLNAVLVGASAATKQGIVFDWLTRVAGAETPTKITDYEQFYHGWVDEVRVWDGAREAGEIARDYAARRRYTPEDCAANRKAVYDAWIQGGTFAPDSPVKRPAELRYHYSFDHLPGATEEKWVSKAPSGFLTEPKETAPDARAWWARPEGWESPWLAAIDASIYSTIYSARSWTPWIGNTVAHLPRFDGTTVDSTYWAGNSKGGEPGAYAFPRNGETASKWRQFSYMVTERQTMVPTRFEQVAGDPLQLLNYVFALRHSLRAGADLLPFGGAFPKRISALEGGMWDDKGPADAWAETGTGDSNLNKLPEWWETYARIKYNKGKVVDWNTQIMYDGVLMPAHEAYLRDLAKGMLPDKKYHDEFADFNGYDENGNPLWRDVDGDGLPDWWEEMYGIQRNLPTDGDGDPDNDGLSNYQEYRIGEYCRLYAVNPTLTRTFPGQEVPDYFLVITNVVTNLDASAIGRYVGEVFADHDFMEDDLEAGLGTDPTKYDAWSDADEDGWSAFAELRYSTFKKSGTPSMRSHFVGTEEVGDYPVPVIRATLRYNGERAIAGSNATVVVEGYSGNDLQKAPNATFTVTSDPGKDRYFYIGPYTENLIHGTLAPGYIARGLDDISLQVAHVQPNDQWSWTVNGQPFKGTYAQMLDAYRNALGTNTVITSEAFNFDTRVVNTFENHDWLQVSVDDATQKGYLLLNHERAGEIDLNTGDFTLDLSKMGGLFMNGQMAMEQYFYRIRYRSQLPTMQARSMSVSLAQADSGYLTEGLTAFVAYMDFDGDGFTPGKDPIGYVKDVDVGWDKVPELVIEMTDSTAAGDRFACPEGASRVRIFRTKVNGVDIERKRVAFSRTQAEGSRPAIFEADYQAGLPFGLDGKRLHDFLTAPNSGYNITNVTEVGYEVVVDETNVVKTFSVKYAGKMTAPTAVSPTAAREPVVEVARPTFRWTGPSDCTAFRFQIRTADESLTNYVSETLVLPPRDSTGAYVWQPQVYVATNVCGDAWALDNNTNYSWRVAMYNAKWSDTNDTASVWSDWAEFSTAVAAKNGRESKYGTAKVSVRYFGPGSSDASLSNVVVQLYRNADFTGAPVAQTRLAFAGGSLTNLAATAGVAAFGGLESGELYATAFVDRNGNGRRDRFETWGYLNQVGTGVAALYTPVALRIDAGVADTPEAEIFMEDTDIQPDRIPDCEQSLADLEAAVRITRPADERDPGADDDGDGLCNRDEEEYGTDPDDPDTDDDGLPDGWEVENDTDPLNPDSDLGSPYDVMAYAEESVRVCALTNAQGEATWYAVNVGSNGVQKTRNVFYRTFKIDNDERLYVGAPTNLPEDVRFAYDTIATNAVLMHSAVYDWYGFDPNTARPATGTNAVSGVHTKTFTVLDKYITAKYYLPQFGVTGCRTLRYGIVDGNGNGIADGTELYYAFANPDPTDRRYIANVNETFPLEGLILENVRSAVRYGYDPFLVDADGDGMWNVWEVEQELDPNDPADAALCEEDEVMAFALRDATVVTVWDGADPATTNDYVFVGGPSTILRTGMDVYTEDLELRRTWKYRVNEDESGTNFVECLALGLPANGVTGKIFATREEKVALVHAFAYEVLGYNMRTANPEAYLNGESEDTKPMTALDKFQLVRYFEALGFCDFWTVFANGDWADWTLPVDSKGNADHDALADGWELYVMFGNAGLTASLDDAKISPFDPTDAGKLAPADGAMLTVADEFDNGHYPTDPWNNATIGDRYTIDGVEYVISDKDAYAYRLKHFKGEEGDKYADFDNDGLANYDEYDIMKNNNRTLDADNMFSYFGSVTICRNSVASNKNCIYPSIFHNH